MVMFSSVWCDLVFWRLPQNNFDSLGRSQPFLSVPLSIRKRNKDSANLQFTLRLRDNLFWDIHLLQKPKHVGWLSKEAEPFLWVIASSLGRASYHTYLTKSIGLLLYAISTVHFAFAP